MYISRRMDGDVVHICKGILLNHKKEWNWVICRDVDGLRVFHTEWSKSGEKQILYINTYMWNLKKIGIDNLICKADGDTDIENKGMGERGRWDELEDWDWHIYIIDTMYGIGRGFPGGLYGKVSACNAENLGLIPGLGRSPGEGNGNPLQYSCLENPMDGGAWYAPVHGVAKSRTRLSDFPFTFHEIAK